MKEWLIPALALIITAISSQIENNVLPMLMPSIEAQLATMGGGTLYGLPFPFVVKLAWFQGVDWVAFIVDIVIIGIIIWGIESISGKVKKK